MLRKTKKMNFFHIIFAALMLLTGCITENSKKVESEWKDLDRVGAIQCSVWPLKQSEIDIANMIASGAGEGGFVATMRLRNGSMLPVMAETRGRDKINSDDLKSFPIGRDAYVVAMSEWGHEPIAFVVQNKNDRAWLEIRAIRDNRLVSRMAAPLSDEVNSGRLLANKTGWWLQLNHSDSQSSFVHVTPDRSQNWKFVIAAFQSSSKLAHLTASESDADAIVAELPRGTDSDQSQFVMTRVDHAGKFTDFGKMTLPTKGGIESWSASRLGNKLIISVVRGDSMIGQASLLVAATSNHGGGALAWKKEFPMFDTHLGEPVWLSNGSRAILGLIRWVDGESSLSRIKVDKEGAELLTDVGVFAKGSVLVAGYLKANENGLGAFRYRENDMWKYKICRLSL